MSSSRRVPTRAFVAALAVFVSLIAAGPASAAVVINEVESSGAADFIEIANNGGSPVDVGGYVLKDSDDTHSLTIPSGTTLAAGAYYVANTEPTFGLGNADSARVFTSAAADATLVDSYSWTTHAAVTYGRCADKIGSFATTISATPNAANDCPVVINEVDSDGGTDFVEVANKSASAVDIGNWVVKDNDDAHALTIPAGTTLAAGGYYVANTEPAFGLGGADSARLYTSAALGSTLVDSYSWTSHATTTYGRCPDKTGAFATTARPTPNAANDCSTPPQPAPVAAWPGGASVAFADDAATFATNLSGLTYEPSGTSATGVLWGVVNGPGSLYRLVYDGTKWTPDTMNSWGSGKQLRYPDGSGDPDSEGVTLAGDDADGIYVATERNNANNGVSRPAILRYDRTAAGTTLTATNDWNLTADLPGLGANLGLEAITWIPDGVLTSKGFVDANTNAPYNPATYGGHGTGLFFVGVEADGRIIAYALNRSTGSATKIATIPSGFPGVMGLEYEPETSHLWATCDNTCNGRSSTLDVAQSGADKGKFAVTNTYERPTGMANLNNEGFAIAPQAECVNGLKPVFWSDDNDTESHALRVGTLNCTVPTSPATPDDKTGGDNGNGQQQSPPGGGSTPSGQAPQDQGPSNPVVVDRIAPAIRAALKFARTGTYAVRRSGRFGLTVTLGERADLTISATARKSAKAKSRTILKSTVKRGVAAGKRTLTFRLSSEVRRTLKKGETVTLKVVARDAAGNKTTKIASGKVR